MKISGRILDLHTREIYGGSIYLKDDKISGIKRSDIANGPIIMPGLIDAHIHIESSMVTPGAFAAAAVSRGTTAVVSDPHEIANVLGIEGVKYMMEDAKEVPLRFYFGAPSCVPATLFESAGAQVNLEDIKELLDNPEIKYLAEMMNFPGVLNNDPLVIGKIDIAKNAGKNIDGHAPGLTGHALEKYIKAGISTDHECTNITEAKEKLSHGMKILIREGSAAKNLSNLKGLFRTDPDMIMLCSDDLHPEMLLKGHINKIVADLISDGYDLFNVIRSCTYNPAYHYKLDAGILQPGQKADLIIVDDLHLMNVLETWIDGKKVFDRGKVLFHYNGAKPINKFNCSKIEQDDIAIKKSGLKIRVIKAFDGDLLTRELIFKPSDGKYVETDVKSDILKIVVKDRYQDAPPAVGFINGFGLKKGAMASSVAHDSHNIVCIGADDSDIVKAINEVVEMKGGLSVSVTGKISSLPLPVAGIMSDKPVYKVAETYEDLSEKTKSLGCRLSAPFMTLSFMALLVIPELKMSDRGLFDGRIFRPVPLFIE